MGESHSPPLEESAVVERDGDRDGCVGWVQGHMAEQLRHCTQCVERYHAARVSLEEEHDAEALQPMTVTLQRLDAIRITSSLGSDELKCVFFEVRVPADRTVICSCSFVQWSTH
jgi:hypothetical protein